MFWLVIITQWLIIGCLGICILRKSQEIQENTSRKYKDWGEHYNKCLKLRKEIATLEDKLKKTRNAYLNLGK